jgi:predicted Zn-dependent protease
VDRRSFITTTLLGGAGLLLPDAARAEDHLIQLAPLELNAHDHDWPVPYHESLITGVEKYFKVSVELGDTYRMRVGDANAKTVLDTLEELRSEHTIGLTGAPLILPDGTQSILISGLGYDPGAVAIATTYWRCRNVSLEVALHRLLGIVLHEISHNFGVGECGDQSCIMYNDPVVPRKSYDVPHAWCKKDSDALRFWLK